LQEGGCKKCAIPSLHRDTFLARLPIAIGMAGRQSLAGAVVVRQLAEQPTFIAGPLGTIYGKPYIDSLVYEKSAQFLITL